MAMILADVGGTNVRFACAPAGVIDASLTQRFENDGYPSFDAALKAYLSHIERREITGLTVAVAGPVTGQTARLTNRNWGFDTKALSLGFGVECVSLMNDLSALGYALDHLGEGDLETVVTPLAPPPPAAQRLVVGMGTGFNVSPVLRAGGQTHCLGAEAGLASMPSRALKRLEAYIGRLADWVRCVEDVFSGPGLSRLHSELSNTPEIGGRAVMDAACEGDKTALSVLNLYAELIGDLLQDLRLHYMPVGGIYLAGSVIRGVVSSPSRERLLQVLADRPALKSEIAPMPVSLITQDEAALKGCLAYALSRA